MHGRGGRGHPSGFFFHVSGDPFAGAGPEPEYKGRSFMGRGHPAFFEEVSDDEDDYYDSEEDDVGAEYKYYMGQQLRERARQEAQERERQRVGSILLWRALACHLHGHAKLLVLEHRLWKYFLSRHVASS